MQGYRQHAGDRGTTTMADNMHPRHTQLIDDCHQLGDVIPNVVVRICGSMAAQAMTRQVDRYHSVVGKEGRQHGKTERIVQPSVDRKNQGFSRIAPSQSSISESVGFKHNVSWLAIHYRYPSHA